MGEPAQSSVYVPEPGKVAIRDEDGSVSLISQGDMDAARAEGARPATEAEYFGAKTGKVGQLASAAIGAGRGASFGLSDAAFIEGSRLIGGDAEAEDTRRALNLAKQVNPNADLAGEIGGAIIPSLFGAPTAGGVARLGEGAVARFGVRALEAAPRAVAEGVGIGLGQQFSEDELQNRPFAASAYLTSAIKGGTIGLLLGAGGAGVLGAAGDKVAQVRGQLFGTGERAALRAEESAGTRLAEESPYRTAARAEEAAATEQAGRKSILQRIDELANEQAYKATGANRTDWKALGRTAEEQAAEAQGVGARLRTETFEGKPLVEATTSEKEINRRVVGRADEVGKELGAMRAKLDTTSVRPDVSAITRRFEEEVAAPALRLPGGEAEIKGAEDFLSGLVKKGGDAPSFDFVHSSRRKLDRMQYDIGIPKTQRDAYAALRNIIEEEYTAAGERAAKEIGETFADNYRLKKALYADLATARDASNRATGGSSGNNAVSITDVIAGATGGLGGLAAMGVNMVRRKYGNQIAAHVLDTATRMESVQRAAAKMDELFDHGSKAFISGSKTGTRPMKLATSDEIRALREATRAPEAVTARVSSALGNMPAVAPKVAQEAALGASRAAAWLQQVLPKDPPPVGLTLGKRKEPPISDSDRLKATAAIETIADPSIVVDRLQQGRLTPEHVAALKYFSPESYQKLRDHLARHATELDKELNQQQLTKLGMLFGEPLSEADLPENIRAFQASFTQGSQAPGKGGAGGNTGPAAMTAGPVNVGGSSATGFDKLEAGT